MIQDIAPRKFDNQYRNGAVPKEDSPIIFFEKDRMEKIMAHVSDGRMRYPLYREMPEGLTYIYLFSIDDDEYFLGLSGGKADSSLFTDLEPVGVRELRPKYYHGDEDRHVIYMTVPSEKERALVCPGCGRTIYPRILPAVIIGVTDGDRILMTKYANRGISFYALVAGFNEIGETLEETVSREVMEEVGLKVKNIRYYKSQPWGIVDDLLAGFYCDIDGDTQITLDKNELKEAVWVNREDVEGQPHDLSLTNEMMIVFREGKEPLGYRYSR